MNSQISGPIIGIMTARKSDGSLTGNAQLFKEIQKKLISLNGISFVFTFEDVKDEAIAGYRYSPKENRWFKGYFPYPDLVYNRIPFRREERLDECQSFFSLLKEKNIPFFNPCFIDKHELYQLFISHHVLRNYLPKFMLVSTRDDLQLFLTTHESIYLKPANSSKGQGIFRLYINSENRLLLEGNKTVETFLSFAQFWEEWHERLLTNRYLAQEEIDSALHEGFRYDFRILAHANHGDYTVTGIGIRQAQKQEITTHIPSGGRLLPYEKVQSTAHDEFIQTIVPPIGNALSEQFGFFGEFSIDATVSRTGNYYIFEVNSKPMSFDEPEIEAQKINQLCQLFLQLTQKAN